MVECFLLYQRTGDLAVIDELRAFRFDRHLLPDPIFIPLELVSQTWRGNIK
jgi:hypothetical protein